MRCAPIPSRARRRCCSSCVTSRPVRARWRAPTRTRHSPRPSPPSSSRSSSASSSAPTPSRYEPRAVWLRVLSGSDAGRTVEVPAEHGRPFVLGRVQGCDLVIRDERASRHHAELRPEPAGGLRVRDLGSANGTFVDGRRGEEAVLAGGEELSIAGVEIAVLARRPEPQAEPEGAPSWSVVGRLVEHRTRGARRATWAALAAAALALVAVGFVLAAGRDEKEAVPDVVRRLAPSTVLVEALRGDRRTATGSGWVLDARRGLVVTAAHVINQGD